MHDGKSCDVGQISIYSPQIKGTYAAMSVTEDTGQNSQLYNSAMSPRCNKEPILDMTAFKSLYTIYAFDLSAQKEQKSRIEWILPYTLKEE